jgi:hypothetical protein
MSDTNTTTTTTNTISNDIVKDLSPTETPEITITPVDSTTSVELENTEKEKKRMIENITRYRNIALSFINAHKKDLVSIYLQHTKTVAGQSTDDNDNTGVLGINMVEMEERQNIDVAFLPLRILPPGLVATILERQQQNNEHIIYFLMINPIEEKLIELDIRALTE